MRIQRIQSDHRVRGRAAFTIAEILIAMALIATSGVALLSGLSSGFVVMRFARENLRATQIMLEKVETIRLYSWDQVTQTSPTTFIPTSFTAPYDPNATNGSGSGPTYTGSLVIEPISAANMDSSYSNSLRKITVSLSWQTGTLVRSRQFSSYVSRYGLQDYIY